MDNKTLMLKLTYVQQVSYSNTPLGGRSTALDATTKKTKEKQNII